MYVYLVQLESNCLEKCNRYSICVRAIDCSGIDCTVIVA